MYRVSFSAVHSALHFRLGALFFKGDEAGAGVSSACTGFSFGSVLILGSDAFLYPSSEFSGLNIEHLANTTYQSRSSDWVSNSWLSIPSNFPHMGSFSQFLGVLRINQWQCSTLLPPLPDSAVSAYLRLQRTRTFALLRSHGSRFSHQASNFDHLR
jgi:hypothetical protein